MSRTGVCVLAGVCGLAGAARGQTGPDVIVGDISEVLYEGVVGTRAAFAVGTVGCNIGTANAAWDGATVAHPIITQNIYKLKNGRFEQIGQSWAKHTFSTVNDSFCGMCTGGTSSATGPGCSDPYTAAMNGGQLRLGPRSEVNVTAGVFPYPYTLGWQQTGDAIYKRCQVLQTDLQDPGVLFFAEAQYVSADDAGAGNGRNNASHRRFTVAPPGYTATVQGETAVMEPAIFAWQENGLGVGIPDPGVTLAPVDYTEQELAARFWVGAKVSDNGDGSWHYEYAVQNLNSHRAAGAFSVPLPPGGTVWNLAWHGVPSHSGEVYDTSAWSTAASGTAVTFSCPQTYSANPDANALRWGTLYNFRFDSGLSPGSGAATIGLFAPGGAGEPESLSLQVPIPGGCYANCDSSTAPPLLNVQDFTCFLQRFAAADPYANCDHSTAIPALNVQDFTCFLQRYAGGCP
jgi:hypothetical protein